MRILQQWEVFSGEWHAIARPPAPRLPDPLPDGLRDLFRVAFGFDAAKDLRDAAVGVDDEGRSQDTHVFAPEHHLLTPHTVRVGDRMIRIGDEREGQIELRLELLMLLHGVWADAEDRRVDGVEPR